MLGITP